MGRITTSSFTNFLAENTTGKLTHLTHLEDLILDAGAAGAAHAVDVLLEFGNILQNGGVSAAMNVTVKWDGAPSIVFGPDPADGRFFVATKAAFSKTPKLMKSQQEIHDTYGDSGVANKLHACFSELSQMRPKQILQGDLLFTDDVTTQTLDGKSYLTFRPNTILYAVDATSALGRRIARARLGMVVHTMYAGSGRSLANYHSAPISPSAFAKLPHSGAVVLLDAAFDDMSGTVTFTEQEHTDYTLLLQKITQDAQHIPATVFTAVSAEPLHALLTKFFNQRIRQGQEVPATVDECTEWLSAVQSDEEAKRSSPRGKEAVKTTFTTLQSLLRAQQRGFTQWFRLHADLSRAKVLVVRKLARISRIQSFLPTTNGFKVSGPEGFVAVSHEGRAVKLVDRLEFSRANFLAPKNWQ